MTSQVPVLRLGELGGMETIRCQVLPLFVVSAVAAGALTGLTLGFMVADETACGRAIESHRGVVVD